jgi:predicted nucleic acid-binding protein
MANSKISVTVPEEVLNEIKKIAASTETKVSHLVTEALSEKIKKVKEEAFVSQINKAFEDPEVIKEQHKMAEDIANSMNIMELPW